MSIVVLVSCLDLCSVSLNTVYRESINWLLHIPYIKQLNGQFSRTLILVNAEEDNS